MTKLNMAVIGCGDFIQRWEAGTIAQSQKINVKSLFDLNQTQAEKLQQKIGGTIVETADAVFDDPDIQIVCIFTPPWVRKELMIKAAESGKHILATKPLSSNLSDCEAIVNGVSDKVKCGVLYGRGGDAVIEKLKEIFDSGEIGKLALYKQDWIHAYPQWNDWATDPDKNGGPFMDAMIHNLNNSRYLMRRKTTGCTLFSDNHVQNLKCNDTEYMKVDFEGNGSAHLFITWAADLEVFSLEGNDREHIDIFYMITDQGWRVTTEWIDDKAHIIASKQGKKKEWLVDNLYMTTYDAFADSIMNNVEMRSDIVSVQQAYEDMLILKSAEQKLGVGINISV